MNLADRSESGSREASTIGLRVAVMAVRFLALPIIVVAVLVWLLAVLVTAAVSPLRSAFVGLIRVLRPRQGPSPLAGAVVEPLSSRGPASQAEAIQS